jgi:hypothetical protein
MKCTVCTCARILPYHIISYHVLVYHPIAPLYCCAVLCCAALCSFIPLTCAPLFSVCSICLYVTCTDSLPFHSLNLIDLTLSYCLLLSCPVLSSHLSVSNPNPNPYPNPNPISSLDTSCVLPSLLA